MKSKCRLFMLVGILTIFSLTGCKEPENTDAFLKHRAEINFENLLGNYEWTSSSRTIQLSDPVRNYIKFNDVIYTYQLVKSNSPTPMIRLQCKSNNGGSLTLNFDFKDLRLNKTIKISVDNYSPQTYTTDYYVLPTNPDEEPDQNSNNQIPGGNDNQTPGGNNNQQTYNFRKVFTPGVKYNVYGNDNVGKCYCYDDINDQIIYYDFSGSNDIMDIYNYEASDNGNYLNLTLIPSQNSSSYSPSTLRIDTIPDSDGDLKVENSNSSNSWWRKVNIEGEYNDIMRRLSPYMNYKAHTTNPNVNYYRCSVSQDGSRNYLTAYNNYDNSIKRYNIYFEKPTISENDFILLLEDENSNGYLWTVKIKNSTTLSVNVYDGRYKTPETLTLGVY